MATSPLNRLTPVDDLVSCRLPPDEIGLIKSLDGTFALKDKEKFPFTAAKQLTGQFIWTSSVPINSTHVHDIMKHALNFKQSVHINTGTHGNESGDTVVNKKQLGESAFTKEDMQSAWNEKNVSIHIVSSHANPIYPPNADHVIDAWCHSKKSADKVAKATDGIFLRKTCQTCHQSKIQQVGHHGTFNIIQKKSKLIDKSPFDEKDCCGVPQIQVSVVVKGVKHRVECMKQGESEPHVIEGDPTFAEEQSYTLEGFYKYYEIKT